MSEAMKQRFGLIKRPWGVYYLKNKTTGEQSSLKTRDEAESHRLLQAHNDTESQPHFNLALARVYMSGADPKLGTRTWQEVMEHIVANQTDETRRRWDVAILDKNFDCIRFASSFPQREIRSFVYLDIILRHTLSFLSFRALSRALPALAPSLHFC